MEAMLGQVADAVNNAPDGSIIAGSECEVCDRFATLRQEAHELAMKMRGNAAEAASVDGRGLPHRAEGGVEPDADLFRLRRRDGSDGHGRGESEAAGERF
jgi:hypothetical protein